MLDMGLSGILLLLIALAYFAEGQDRDYKLVLEDADIGFLDKDYLEEVSYLEITYKDEQPVVNGIVEFKKGFPPETTAMWEVLAKDENNEEMLKASGPKSTLCKFVKEQKNMADMVIQYSNLPRECPYVKGKYEIKDAMVHEEVFPVKIPKDKPSYKLRMNFHNDSKPILIFWIECRVEWSK